MQEKRRHQERRCIRRRAAPAQAADRAVETGSVAAATSNQDTEAQKDRVEVNGKDVTSLLTGGLFATDASQANFDLRYTSEANMVGANQQMGRSTFTIIA